MHRTRSRIASSLAVTTLVLGVAAGPLSAQSPTASEGAEPAGSPANPTSAEGYGGMEAQVAAAQAEGALNVIALPPDWANYGQMIEDFSTTYAIEVDSQQPDANSQQEIDAVNNLAGTDAAPDVLDLGANVALANTHLFAPYMVASWADIPDNLKEASGLWVSDYTGFMSIGCDAGRVPVPATVADLLKPEYAGAVALNGNPTTASAGFHGVVMAALANDGSADDISAGVEFFNQLNEAGNLLPVDPTPATIQSGQTPCVIDWEYTNAAQTDALAGQIDWQVVIPSDAPPVAAYYIQAINADAPHPAAARLWQEYLFSPEGQNTWLVGYARPVLQDKLVADGTIDQEALGKLAEATGTPVVLTQEQLAAGQAYLTANWAIELPNHLTTEMADVVAPPPLSTGRTGAGFAPGGSGSHRMRRAADYLPVVPFLAFVAIFLLVPTAIVVLGAFQGDGGAWTLGNIETVLATKTFRDAFVSSIVLSAQTAIAGAVLGGLLAWAVAISEPNSFLRRNVIAACGVLAQFGGVMLAFAFLATFGFNGLLTIFLRDVVGVDLLGRGTWIYGMTGLALVYTYFQIPLMVIIFLPALDGLRREWMEASNSLGGSGWHYWRHIGAPILAPSFLGALLLLFANAFSAYATAAALVSQGAPIVTLQIRSALSSEVALGQANIGKALALGMIVIVAIVMTLYTLVQRRASRWVR